jgi:hypothetical protein
MDRGDAGGSTIGCPQRRRRAEMKGGDALEEEKEVQGQVAQRASVFGSGPALFLGPCPALSIVAGFVHGCPKWSVREPTRRFANQFESARTRTKTHERSEGSEVRLPGAKVFLIFSRHGSDGFGRDLFWHRNGTETALKRNQSIPDQSPIDPRSVANRAGYYRARFAVIRHARRWVRIDALLHDSHHAQATHRSKSPTHDSASGCRFAAGPSCTAHHVAGLGED